ncbi:hypothetical protein, partial [Pantoea ananatis]
VIQLKPASLLTCYPLNWFPPKLATRAYGTIAGQIKASKQRKTNKKIATFIHMQNPEMDYAIPEGFRGR